MIRPEADTVEYFDFDWLEKKQFDQAMGTVIRFCYKGTCDLLLTGTVQWP